MEQAQPTIVVLGGSGQVGGELRKRRPPSSRTLFLSRSEADLLRPDDLPPLVEKLRPDILVNCAAYTAVDLAETERVASRTANATSPGALAEACHRVGARMIHLSTDYVFNGEGTRPYLESDPVDPVNAYGRDKLEGEQAVLAADPRHLVFRLSWVYGNRGKNFALTMLRLAREGKPIRVVADQVGSPTFAPEIAKAIDAVLTELAKNPGDEGGLFHLSAADETSWHGFAVALLDAALAGMAPPVEAIATSQFPTPARRPRYSKLDNGKVEARFGVRLPSWDRQVKDWSAALE